MTEITEDLKSIASAPSLARLEELQARSDKLRAVDPHYTRAFNILSQIRYLEACVDKIHEQVSQELAE